MVLIITDGSVAVTRDFLINLGEWGRDIVRVKVAASLRVNQTENVAVGNKLRWCLAVELWLAAVGVEKPLVVGILVMVAGDLLLSGALWVCLDVRMEKSTTVSHVLNGCAGSVGNLERAVLSNLRTAKVSLEQGAHLSISWAAILEDSEMGCERQHVDDERKNNQPSDSGANVGSEFDLGHLVVPELVPEIFNGVESDEGSAKEANPLDTAHAANAQSSQPKPCEPLEAEALVLKSVEPGPAQNSRECEAQQHRVEKNKSADSRVGVFAENHKSDEPHCWSFEVELSGSVVG